MVLIIINLNTKAQSSSEVISFQYLHAELLAFSNLYAIDISTVLAALVNLIKAV